MPDWDKVIAGKNGPAKRVTCARSLGRFLMCESSTCTAMAVVRTTCRCGHCRTMMLLSRTVYVFCSPQAFDLGEKAECME